MKPSTGSTLNNTQVTDDLKPAATEAKLQLARKERPILQAQLVIEWCTPALDELRTSEVVATQSVPRERSFSAERVIDWTCLKFDAGSTTMCGIERDQTNFIFSDMPGGDDGGNQVQIVDTLSVNGPQGTLCFDLTDVTRNWLKADSARYRTVPGELSKLLSLARVTFSPAEGTQLQKFSIECDKLPRQACAQFKTLIGKIAEEWIRLVREHEIECDKRSRQDRASELTAELAEEEAQNTVLKVLLGKHSD